MADLIELDLVVRDKGLKASVSTVERLERQIVKAQKAVDQNTISQARYNKILLNAKREYQSLGLSSQKATAQVRAFAAANKMAQSSTAAQTVALDAATVAQRKLNAAQAQTKNKMNGNNMAIQQLGYQFGDFAVQVQGGTSAFVAFSQQGSQLAGILPMIAGPLGLSMGAAVGLSAALGILIPIGSAVGRMFFDTGNSAKQAVVEFETALSNLESISTDIATSIEASLSAPFTKGREELNKLMLAYQSLQDLVAKEALAKDALPILGDLSKRMDELADLKKQTQDLAEESNTDYSTYLRIIAQEQSETMEIFNKFKKALDGPSEDLVSNMMAVGTAFSESEVATQDMKDAMVQLLGSSGILASATKAQSDLDKAEAERQKDQANQKAAFDAFELAAAIKDGKIKRKEELAYQKLLNKTRVTMGLMAAERRAAAKAITEEDRTEEIKRLAKLELDLFKTNQAYEKKQKTLDAAGDLAILKNQAAQELALFRENNAYETKASAERVKVLSEIKRQEELIKKAQDTKFNSQKASLEASIAEANFAKLHSDELIVQNLMKLRNIEAERVSGDLTNERAAVLSKLVNIETDLLIKMRDTATEAKELKEALESAAKAMSDLNNFGTGLGDKIEIARVKLAALESGANAANAATIAGYKQESKALRDLALNQAQSADQAIKINKAYEEQEDQIVTLEGILKATDDVTEANNRMGKSLSEADKLAAKLAKDLEEALNGPVISAIGSVSSAWGNFISRGLTDFKGFVSQILGSFQSMIAQMIATATSNKIMIGLGLGGAGFATGAGAAGVSSGFGAGALGSFVGNYGAGGIGGAGAGLLGGIGAFSGGIGAGFGASFGSLGTILSGGSTVAAGGAGFATTLGAAIPAIAAIAVVVGLLTKKTKELDKGLQVTVDGMDSVIESFRVTQSSRLFGLLKGSKKTSVNEVVEGPLFEAVNFMQDQVASFAKALDFGADTFKDFTYDFKLSLKGMTEEEQLQALQEELLKMGDAMSELVPLVGSFNELAAVAEERVKLENQLLQAEGDLVELRKQELDTVHILNKELAARLHVLQAESDMQGALGAFASGIAEQQGVIRRAVDALVKPLQDAIDDTRAQAEKSYTIFRAAADQSVKEAQTLVDIVTGAISSRTIKSEAVELMSYQKAQQQLSSFSGGASFDETSLRKATQGVSIDSEKFFGSFEDYARDFYKTQISLEDIAAKAEEELSDAEKQIEIAEKAYEVSLGIHEETISVADALKNLTDDLDVYDATKLANEPLIDMVKETGQLQIDTLDAVLIEVTKQINTLLGIENNTADLIGTNMSISEAMGVIGIEANSLAGGVLKLDDEVAKLGLYTVGFDGTVDVLNTKVTELGSSTDDLGINVTSLGETLSNAMSGLGSIVSGLSGAISGLASANNALASAQAAQAKATSEAAAAQAAQAAASAAASAAANQAAVDAEIEASTNPDIKIISGGITATTNKSDMASGVSVNGVVYSTNRGASAMDEVSNAAALAIEAGAMTAEHAKAAGIKGYKTGGYHTGGLRLVGENGPEIESTGPSRIYNKRDTMQMLSGGNSGLTAEIRGLRGEVAQLRAEQRKVGVENVKYNKKSYDLYREWDTVGLPATRTS